MPAERAPEVPIGIHTSGSRADLIAGQVPLADVSAVLAGVRPVFRCGGQLTATRRVGVDQPGQVLSDSEKPYWLAGCLAEAEKPKVLATASPS